MSQIRPWAVQRRAIYLSILAVIFVLLGVTVYYSFLHKPPSCFDQRQNGSETGIDCGGSCTRICVADIKEPRVVWVNGFEVQPGQYNAVAYIENTNQFAGADNVPYTITLKNGDEIVAERSGVTVLPPNMTYPIFEGRILTDNQSPITTTEINLTLPEVWQPATVQANRFRTRDIELFGVSDRPRLEVDIENTEITPVTDVEVVATIFSADGQPVAVSRTTVDRFLPESIESVIFTWPHPIARTVRTCIVPTDIALAIDLSGSMNNDGDNPPQPLTDTLAAASNFANQLGENDQLGLVTFASTASLNNSLTKAHQSVAGTIQALTIDPVEETGFTNTRAALEAAGAELQSANHNVDARRAIVLLTDGLPTADDETDIVAETVAVAEALDAAGIAIYVIGLGVGVDQAFLERVASTPEQAFSAPTTENLSSIYSAINGDLCEAGPARIDVIAKPMPVFTPLR